MSAASPEDTLFPVPARLLDSAQCPEPYVKSFKQYKELHRQSIENSDEFFGKVNLAFMALQVSMGRIENGRGSKISRDSAPEL